MKEKRPDLTEAYLRRRARDSEAAARLQAEGHDVHTLDYSAAVICANEGDDEGAARALQMTLAEYEAMFHATPIDGELLESPSGWAGEDGEDDSEEVEFEHETLKDKLKRWLRIG